MVHRSRRVLPRPKRCALLQAEPEKAAAYAGQIRRPRVQSLPGIIALYQTIAVDLKLRAGGNHWIIPTAFTKALVMTWRSIEASNVSQPTALLVNTSGRIADPVLTDPRNG